MPNALGQPFRIRSLTWSVYLPTFLFAVGQGAVIPIVPLFARELGASVAVAGTIVAVRGLGIMFFDVPAGVLITRLGERGAMLVGTGALAVVAVGAAFSPGPLAFAALMFVMGCAWSIWMLARLSYATEQAPLEHRGRVLSLIGGSNRIGNFIGPFLGGFAGVAFGLEAAFFLQAALALAAAGTLFFTMVADGSPPEVHPDTGHSDAAYKRIFAVVHDHRAVFATAGVASVAIQVLRSSRQAIIPLWGEHIGLDAGQIGVIFGLTSAIDMTLFYPVGIMMDRLGRKWAGVPCLLVMSLGMLAIPATANFAGLLLAGLVTGVGNGLGSGINMTLGADFSPALRRGEFLGVWRLITDVGTAGGPLVVGALT
ncbi:MAG: MFS transporter, partial [Tepidiformaceae bacterium]